MNCPDCAGAMWDNRNDKRNPKSPDFKCKNKSCGKGIWEERKPNETPAVMPSNGNGHAIPTAPNGKRPLGPLYGECLEFAQKACTHYLGDVSHADVIAAAATLFIAATRDGTPLRAPKAVAPPPPPPPPPEPVYSSADDLPF
jgi:hypothetical protein